MAGWIRLFILGTGNIQGYQPLIGKLSAMSNIFLGQEKSNKV